MRMDIFGSPHFAPSRHPTEWEHKTAFILRELFSIRGAKANAFPRGPNLQDGEPTN
jgi:hypothetical protein